MLNAVLRHKDRRHFDQLKLEDVLTSFVFEYLLLLDDKTVWSIVRDSIISLDGIKDQAIQKKLDKKNDIGTLCTKEFWPHWSAEGASNERLVEPDVFFRFTELDVIIEAKRYDDHQQDSQQWENEVQGYLNEYKENKKDVILIALGGINTDAAELIEKEKKIYVCKCRWTDILRTIKYRIKDSKNQTETETETKTKTETKIYEALVDVFSIFGFHVVDWEAWNLAPSDPSLKLEIDSRAFENWHIYPTTWKGFDCIKDIYINKKHMEVIELWKITK